MAHTLVIGTWVDFFKKTIWRFLFGLIYSRLENTAKFNYRIKIVMKRRMMRDPE